MSGARADASFVSHDPHGSVAHLDGGCGDTGENYRPGKGALPLVNADREDSRLIRRGHPMEDKLLFGVMVAVLVVLEVGERLLRPTPIVCGLTAAWLAS